MKIYQKNILNDMMNFTANGVHRNSDTCNTVPPAFGE